MSFRRAYLLSTIVTSLGFAACSASTPTPESPASEAPPSAASPPEEAPPPPEPTEPAQAPVTEPTADAPAPEPAQPAEPEPEPRQAPTAILGAPNAAFVLDYNASGLRDAAEKACAPETADAAKRQECLQKARASFVADVLRFKKTAQGKWRWTIYQRKGSSLPEVYQADVELSDESKNSVKVKIKGGESGSRPLFAGTKQGVISFPNDYSIVLEDPKHGRLIYDAKVGLVGD
jgi:hypothetical protein